MERKRFSEPQLDTIEGLTAKLLEVNHKLQKSEAARSQMLENISHDLRAPLTAIRSAVDYLMELQEDSEVNAEEIRQLANLLDMRTKTLEVLVSDLYYLTSLDNTNNSLKLEEVPLGAFLEDYFLSATIDEKYDDRKLDMVLPEEFPYMVMMDVSRLTRVMDNLFTNALKYSNSQDFIALEAYVPGAEELRTVMEEYDGSGYVAFCVRDSGIGIAPEKVERVFERMFMVSDARTPAQTTGSGLGLAIVKGIVEKHDGKITCKSKLGEGSCFTVYLRVCDGA